MVDWKITIDYLFQNAYVNLFSSDEFWIDYIPDHGYPGIRIHTGGYKLQLLRTKYFFDT